MRHCPNCGSEISDSDRFCYRCGADTSNVGPDEPREDTVQPSSDRTFSPSAAVSGPNKGSMIAVVVVVAILMAASIGGVLLLSNSFNETQKTSDEKSITYDWEDGGVKMTYTLTVKKADYDSMMKSTIDRTGSISSDRYTTKDNTVVVAVKEYVVVDSYIQKLADDLKAKCKEKVGHEPSVQELVQFLANFVQGAISYDKDEADSGNEYWRFPLETLWDKKGDCEDTSILLSALINASGDAYKGKGAIVLLPGHAMAAVDSSLYTTPLSYSKWHSNVYDCDYYVIETAIDSAYWDVGKIGDEYSKDYLHFYSGYVTSYYGVSS